MRRSRRRGIRRTAKTPVRWTGNESNGIVSLAGSALFYAELAGPADYDISGTLEQGGVTLLRTVGNICLWNAAITTVVHAAIFLLDTSGAPPVAGSLYDPTVFAQFIRGDLIWQRKHAVQTANMMPIEIPFDTKRKAKMESDAIYLVLKNETANAINFCYQGRCLLKGT